MIYYGENATPSKATPAKNAFEEYTTAREE
jgi:hypothetical protein